MEVEGNTGSNNPNIRREPTMKSNSFDWLEPNTPFKGNLVEGKDGKTWIELTEAQGAKFSYPPQYPNIQKGYIAAWVVKYKAVKPIIEMTSGSQFLVPSTLPDNWTLTDTHGNIGEYKLVNVIKKS